MRLSCKQEGNFMIGVFHSISIKPEIISDFVQSVIQTFEKKYTETHESIRKELKDLVDEKIKDADKPVTF